jgi:hypothetical protein
MMNFLSISTILVQDDFVLQAQDHLQAMGKNGCEGVTLWAGKLENDIFTVTATIIPDQLHIRLSSGVCYYVDGKELHRINVWLYKHKMTLIAQLHSHPSNAFHSSTDDSFPIVTLLGSISIVVPDFASEPFSITNCAVYRLFASGWVQLTSNQVKNLFIFGDKNGSCSIF